MIFKSIYRFGDKLEDYVRGKLSHYPLVYAFVGGAGVVLFWRGVWHTVDTVMDYFFVKSYYASSIGASELPWWDGPLSLLVGTILLLMIGLFVSNFIGNEIIISGLRGEKKLAEKTEEEVAEDVKFDKAIKGEMHLVNAKLSEILMLLSKK